MLEPFNFHWYIGDVPPFVIAEVKMILFPAHIAPEGLAEITIFAGTVFEEFTVTQFGNAGVPAL